jgi:hypothetical protein
MFDRQGARRLGVLSLYVASFLFLSIITLATVRGSVNGSPTLTGGEVIPEKGAAGSTFTFEVVYSDSSSLLPADGYPKLYIDGEAGGRTMVENDPLDNNVADGKLYKYEWTPTIENEINLPIFENFKVNNRDPNPGQEAVFSGYLLENHDFYFYAQNSIGENARDPASNVYKGPEVSVSGSTVRLFLLPGENSVEVGSDNTDENGYFSISIEAPSSGSYGYFAEFQGGENNQTSQSDIEALITFNALSIAAISWAISVVLILVFIFFLARGMTISQYRRTLLIGFLLAIAFWFLFGAGLIGFIMAGAIAGYLYARNVSGFFKHLRFGALVAMLFALVYFTISSFLIKTIAADYVIGTFGYSISNGQLLELLISETFFFAFFYGLFVGLGAVLGGILRKALKPAEQRPVTVAGSDTTAASGLRLQG